MDTHPYPYAFTAGPWVRRQALLRLGSGRDSRLGRREHHEETVTFGVQLNPFMRSGGAARVALGRQPPAPTAV
jgi:hypothetical protein